MKFATKGELGIKSFLFIAIPLLGYWIYGEIQQRKAERQYIEALNLHIQGVVRYVIVPDSYNGFGIVGVDIMNSNKTFVDTSAVVKYCVIKNDKAEFYQLGAYNCNIGDTIQADADMKIFTIKKTTGETIVEDIVLYNNELFWKYVKKHTRLAITINTRFVNSD